MQNKYAGFIKSLRLRKNLSQEDVAVAIEVSRPTYVAIEKGTKQLTFDEAKRIAGYFDVTLNDLLEGGNYREQKYKQMIFSFLRKAKTSGKDIKKTKLAKLLYFADFGNYFFFDESMSTLQYRKIEFGPVPDEYFRIMQELEDNSLIKISHELRSDGKYMYSISDTVVSSKIDLAMISKEEDKLIQKIWDKWQNTNTDEIVNYTHLQSPYRKTDFGHIIPYELIKDEDKTNVF